METANKTKIRIVLPYSYEEDGRRLIDFKDRISVLAEGIDIKEAYYSTMAEQLIVNAYIETGKVAALQKKYMRDEPVLTVNDVALGNGRLEIISRVKWL